MFFSSAARSSGRPATLLQPYVRRAMDDAAPTWSFATRAVQEAGRRVLDSRSREAAAMQLSLSGTDPPPRPSVRSASKIFASRLLCTLLQAARLQPRRSTLPLRIARPSTPALSFLRSAAPRQHACCTNLSRSRAQKFKNTRQCPTRQKNEALPTTHTSAAEWPQGARQWLFGAAANDKAQSSQECEQRQS